MIKPTILLLTFMLMFTTLLNAENAFLEEEARAYNKELPKRISSDIVLEKLEYKSEIGFTYFYTLEGVETEERINVIAAKLLSQEEDILRDTCQTSPDFFMLGLISDNTPLIYSYKTIDGKLICNIVLDLNRCSEFEDEDDR